jgi:PadR family transcriptional regulator PadR
VHDIRNRGPKDSPPGPAGTDRHPDGAARRKGGDRILNDARIEDRKFRKELNAGTAALVLLGVVSRAARPVYGYEIAKLIDAGSEEAPMMKQGALYPVLRSLEKTGLLESTVEPSVTGPPRRYYRITEEGRAALDRWTGIWNENRRFVDSVLKGTCHE